MIQFDIMENVGINTVNMGGIMEKRMVNVNNKELNYIDKKDLEKIKDIFAKPIADIVKVAKKNNEEIEPILKVVIPEEFIEELKNGNFKLMESKTGEILPNIVDGKNKIVKQVRLEEVKEKLDDKKVDELGGYATQQKLDAIKEQLECIMCVVEDIEKGQRNDRYGKVDGAIRTIKQSFNETDLDRRNRLQDGAQLEINEAIEAISKEIKDGLSFFKEWEERNFLQKNIGSVKFSTWNINKKFNKLCEDYLYLNRAKTALIELKLSQGMDKYKIDLMIQDLNEVDIEIKERKISNWLAPRSNNNEWQYRLLDKPKYKNELIIEYNIKDFIGEGENNDDK